MLRPASAAVVTISGIVTVDGVPSAGVTITDGFFEPITTVSDENGYYEFLDGAQGFHFLGVLDPDDLYQSYTGSANISETAPTAVVNIALLSTGPATGTVSGTVTIDGVAAEGVTVQVAQFGNPAPSDVSDANGHFEITGLTYGTYSLAIDDPEDLYGETFGWTLFNISSTQQSASVDVAVVSWGVGTASISGVVLDAATGLPMTGARVYLMGSAGNVRPQWVDTDDDGKFELSGIPATTTHLSVSVVGYVGATVPPFAIADGEHVTLEIELVPANAVIHGYVRDASGNGMSGADCWHSPKCRGSDRLHRTGGEYTIGPIAAGDYELTVGGIRTAWNEATLNVTAMANDTVEADLLVEPRDSGSISGYVLSGGGSFEKVCVSAYDESGDVVADAGASGSGIGGTWRIEDLEPVTTGCCSGTATPRASLRSHRPSTAESAARRRHADHGRGWRRPPRPDGPRLGRHHRGRSRRRNARWNHRVPCRPQRGCHGLPARGRRLGADTEPEASLAQTGVRRRLQHRRTPPRHLPGVGFISSGTGPRDYATEYFDDVATVGAADDIVIVGGDTVDEIDASLGIPQPAGAPLAVPTEALDPADKGDIALNKTVVAQGKTSSRSRSVRSTRASGSRCAG